MKTVVFASSADLEGTIEPGDEILAVDGHEPSDEVPLQTLLKGEVGTTVALLLRRGEEDFVVVLTRRVWTHTVSFDFAFDCLCFPFHISSSDANRHDDAENTELHG